MEPAFSNLANALRERLAIIADRVSYERDPAAHFDQLKAVSERLLEIQKQLPASIDPQLDHYLKRCSYDKALAFLEALPR